MTAESVSSKGTRRTASRRLGSNQAEDSLHGRQAAVTSCPSVTSRSSRCRPTKPSAPVTSTLIGKGTSARTAQAHQVGVHHHADQLVEAHLWFPAQLPPRLGGIGLEQVHLSRADEFRIGLNVLLPVESHVSKGGLDQLA